MKITDLIIILSVILSSTFLSCIKKKEEIYIGTNRSVKISGDNGEVVLKFREGSMIIDQIEILDKEKRYHSIQSMNELGLIDSEVYKGDQEFLNQKYLSLKLNPGRTLIYDSLELEITQQLLTNHIIRNQGDLYYLSTYENGEKVYNSLNLKILDAEIEKRGELKLLLKNVFPFKGNLNFYKYDTKTKLETYTMKNGAYLVVYDGINTEDSVVMLDIEIVPSSEDTLVNSTFTQRININQ